MAKQFQTTSEDNARLAALHEEISSRLLESGLIVTRIAQLKGTLSDIRPEPSVHVPQQSFTRAFTVGFGRVLYYTDGGGCAVYDYIAGTCESCG